jgi:hypothetical protein
MYTGPIDGPYLLAFNESTVVPGGAEPFTHIRDDFGFDNGRIAFGGSNSAVSGLYLYDAGIINRIVDSTMRVPESTKDFDLPYSPPSIDNDRIVFAGQSTTTVGVHPLRGVYFARNGNLSRIADTTMPAPGDTRNYTDSFAVPIIDDDKIVFVGNRWDQPGIYLHDLNSGQQSRLVDTKSPVPGRPVSFYRFDALGNGLDFDNDQVVFIGEGPSVKGVYTIDLASGAVATVADVDTLVPGAGLTQFDRHFNAASIDEGAIAFGYGTGFVYVPPATGPGETEFFGVYTNLAGSLERLVDKGDTLDGKLVSRAHLGRQGLEGDQIAVTVEFDDGSKGIYVATLIPEPTTVALLIPAFGLLVVWVRAARTSRHELASGWSSSNRGLAPSG